MSSKNKQIIYPTPLTQLEEIAMVNMGTKGFVSRYYGLLDAYSNKTTLDKLNAWKIDLQDDINETDLYEVCLRVQKQTVNAKF